MTDSNASHVNVGELIRTGIELDTGQAIALIHEICQQAGRGIAFPQRADDLSLSDNGELAIAQSEQAASTDARVAVAALLDTLLPPADSHRTDPVPSPLRTLSTRLRASAESKTVADPRDLIAIIRRYLPDDPRHSLQALVARAGRPAETGADEAEAAAMAGAAAAEVAVVPPVHHHRGNLPNDTLEFFRAEPAGTASGHGYELDGYELESGRSASDRYRWEPVATTTARPGRAGRAAIACTGLALIVASGYAGYTVVDRASNANASSPATTTSEVKFRRQSDTPPASSSRSAAPALEATPVPAVVQPPASPKPSATDRPASKSDRLADADRPYPLNLSVVDGAFSPSFAPTGRELFFHSGRSRDGQMLEADLDERGRASRITPVIAAGDDDAAYHPRLSPDGRLIAFDSDRAGQRGVYVSDRDGSNASRVSGDGYAAAPSWSPDMKWLAFIRAEPGRPRVWNLWLRELASGALTRQTSYRAGQVWAASWFPDSRHLCYSHEDRLVIVDLESGNREEFRTPRAGRLIRTPAVAPDGRRVVFQVFRDGVWLLDLDTQSMRRILDDPTAEEFAWDPAGRRIAYHSRQDGTWRIWMTTLPQS